MNIINFILTMILVAAFNTLIVAIAVYIIFKIRIKKEKIKESHTGAKEPVMDPEMHNEAKKEEEEPVESLIETQIEFKEPKEESQSEKEAKPKFLKYTSKGYIIPEEDTEKDNLRWQ